MEAENRKYIALISFFRKFIKVFFTLFLNIYILQIVNNDLNFVIKYTLFGVVVEFILCYIILNVISSRNAEKIYKSSFILLIITIFLLLIFKERIVEHIFLFKILEKLADMCHSVPYELVIIGSNNTKTMSNFMANINILSGIATILTPIFSGFIIEKFSYYMLFVILIIEALVIIGISFKIKDFTVTNKRLEPVRFLRIAKKKKYLQDAYKCMFYRRISSQGAIVELLPIILFLRVGTELNVGTYNSLFAVISILSLALLEALNKRKIRKEFYYPYMAVIIFISSLAVIFNSNLNTLLIYYILMNSFGAIIESESCSVIYASIRADDLLEFKREHILIYNLYMTIGSIISYFIVYVLYNCFYDVNVLSVSVSILMFFLIISAAYLRTTKKHIDSSKA